MRRLPAAARWEGVLAVSLVAEVAIFAAVAPGFFDGFTGLLSLSQLFIPSGLVALGLAIVVIGGGIDLSVGATAALASVTMAALWQHEHWSIWVAAGAALVLSALLGLVNAVLIALTGVAPLIVTLATSFVYGSIATDVAGSSPPYGFPSSFTYVGQSAFHGVPIQLVVFLGLAAVFVVLLGWTTFGRAVTMIGANPEAARFVGLRVLRTTTLAYVLCSVMAGGAGILLGSYYGAVQTDIGDPLLLTAVTVIVLGGIDIFGGEGGIVGVVLAVFGVGFLQQGLLIKGYADLVSQMATGCLLVVAIALRVGARRASWASLLGRRRRAEPPPTALAAPR